MFKYILPTLKGYKKSYLGKDIVAGIVVAALTIPVAMGYAEVAGLPPIYGLYASILPVVGYALFASSPQLIFGIDASASAITGSVIAGVGIMAGSSEALAIAPVLAFTTALFLFIFAIFKLGRFASYLSMPVMSGFISGIALAIIVGQIPKTLGVTAHGTDFFANISSIFTSFGAINWLSVLIAAASIALILVSKKFLPKIPAALIILVIATVLSSLLHFSDFGVSIVGDIPKGLPHFVLPDIFSPYIQQALGIGFVIAIVVFADSLLSSNSFALRNHYKIDDDRELYAFGASNLLASLTGASPTSASVSRTAASEQFKGKTQVVSIVAAAIIALVVMFFSPLLHDMPQPVLAGIIIAALVSVIEVRTARNLYKRTKAEFFIWCVAAVGVLLIGVLFGVLVGVILSFADFIRRSVSPPQAYLGKIPEKSGYFDMARWPEAKPIPKIVIYRFSSALFFANIRIFTDAVHNIVRHHKPRDIIFDASGITSIDATAAAELKNILQYLEDHKVTYYFAGQIASFDNQLIKFGLGNLIDQKQTTKTIDLAVERAQEKIT